MKTIIDEIEEYVNLQKNIITRIGHDLALSMNYINAVNELLELKEKLESMFGDFCFDLKPNSIDDFKSVNLEVYHITQNGISQTVVKHILDTDLNFTMIYYIEPMTDGIRFIFLIGA